MGIFDVSIPKWLEPVDQTTMAVAGYKGAMEAFQNSYNKAIEQRQFAQKLQLQTAEMAQNLELHTQQLELNRLHIQNEAEKIKVDGELKAEMEKERSAKLADAVVMNDFAKRLAAAKTREEILAVEAPEFKSVSSWATADQMRDKMLKAHNERAAEKMSTSLFKGYENAANDLIKKGAPEGAQILSDLSASKGEITPELSEKIQKSITAATDRMELNALKKAEQLPSQSVTALELQLSKTSDPVKKLELIRQFNAQEDPRFAERYNYIKEQLAKPKPESEWLHPSTWSYDKRGRDEFGHPIEIPPADKKPEKKKLDLPKPDADGSYHITAPIL